MLDKINKRDVVLILIFMVVDCFAVYQYGINVELTEFEAIFAGIIVAALMDIPPYIFAIHGLGTLMDPTVDELGKKRTAKLIAIVSIVYMVLLLGVIITIRVRHIMLHMHDPEYTGLFMDCVLTVSPILTTAFSFILGLIAARPNEKKLKELWDKAANERNHAEQRRDAVLNDMKLKAEKVAAAFGLVDFFPAIREGRDLAGYLAKAHRYTYDEVVDRYTEHLVKCHKAWQDMNSEICTQLEPHGPAPGLLLRVEPASDLKEKAALLAEVKDSFKNQVRSLAEKAMPSDAAIEGGQE